ncbi:helix-turn-helix domain-containing protein [Virgibacillus pantothenticus]|uniref:helix-turn-helix domain-containing protein n=1 Tax=Virgibacillus pantothenticus TaxID=1473 RepID=UPI0025B06999|nr:helix-turn-helix domain-containing protein [Virgibacillus pantothenticus]
MNNFGSMIKKIRKSKNLSLKDVAKRGGLSHAYISQIENGKRTNPTPQVLDKLAKGLDESSHDIWAIAGYYDEDDLLEPIEETIKQILDKNKRLSKKRAKELSAIDLNALLEEPNLKYKNHFITTKEKELIKSYLEALFSDRN